jgi:hypothetical protein
VQFKQNNDYYGKSPHNYGNSPQHYDKFQQNYEKTQIKVKNQGVIHIK